MKIVIEVENLYVLFFNLYFLNIEFSFTNQNEYTQFCAAI